MKKNAIFICGPTAVGKTATAIAIAKWLNTEIVSFDSRQFFQELKIGAAPPSPAELQEVKHHLIGQLSVTDNYTAGDFEKDALEILDKLWEKHQTVVLVGGSGLYMKALIEGFDEMPDTIKETREALNQLFKESGIEALQHELKAKDPDYYQIVDTHNPQRLIRALEVIRDTGKPYSKLRKKNKAQRNFQSIKIGLNLDREELYDRINRRVDLMFDAGLLDEVRSLEAFKDKNSLQTVGYRELFQHLSGQFELNHACEEIKKNSRRYAKRQLTWFRKEEGISWFSPHDVKEIKAYISKSLQ